MSEIICRDGRKIGDGHEPFIVAEVNTSHNGSMEIAREMIQKLKELGCDCVKFQSWSTESLYSKSYYMENPIAKRFVKKLSFSKQQQRELSEYCRKMDIAFASTPYAQDEVDFLIEECNVPYIKIASMDLNNYPFLEYIAKNKCQ